MFSGQRQCDIIVNYLKLQGTPSNSEWGQPVICKSNLYRVSELTIIKLFESLTVWLNHIIHVKCHAARFPSSYEIESHGSLKVLPDFTCQLESSRYSIWNELLFLRRLTRNAVYTSEVWENVLTSETYIFKIYVDI